MKKKLLYVAGTGRSGSTLMDITLGNMHGHFSLGELICFAQNGIIDREFCSCGERVPDCNFWQDIIQQWSERRLLSNDEFAKVQFELLRNKNIIRNFYYLFFPKAVHKKYTKDIQLLYELLFEATGATVLIDSSKNSQYIRQLKTLPYEVRIIHLTRSFSGVMNSTKKELKINPELGLEKDLVPQSFLYAFAIWLIDNFFSWFFSIGLSYRRVKYEKFINNPLEQIARVTDIDENDKALLEQRGPLGAKHLVAGNKLRMSDSVTIRQGSKEPWDPNIKPHHKILAKIIDFFY